MIRILILVIFNLLSLSLLSVCLSICTSFSSSTSFISIFSSSIQWRCCYALSHARGSSAGQPSVHITPIMCCNSTPKSSKSGLMVSKLLHEESEISDGAINGEAQVGRGPLMTFAQAGNQAPGVMLNHYCSVVTFQWHTPIALSWRCISQTSHFVNLSRSQWIH
jgi:hypothetical protein